MATPLKSVNYTVNPFALRSPSADGLGLVDLRYLPLAVEEHDHSAGQGLPVAKLAATPWTTFTPTITQSAGVAATVNFARYALFGKLIVAQLRITITAAGLSGSPVIVGGLAVAMAPKSTGTYAMVGSGVYARSGVIIYPVVAEATTSTQLELYGGNGTGAVGVNPAFATANNDVVALTLSYEIA